MTERAGIRKCWATGNGRENGTVNLFEHILAFIKIHKQIECGYYWRWSGQSCLLDFKYEWFWMLKLLTEL